MSALPDIQFNIDWKDFARKAGVESVPLFQRHQWCAINNRGFGSYYHRRERIAALFPAYEWHRWNERRLRAMCDYRWVTWLGPGACVAGSTRILNPITGEQPTIRELCERGESPVVMTLYGPELASVPFIKGTEKLLRVRLSSGEEFTATAKHRVLTRHGFRSVGDLRTGDSLAAYTQHSASLPESARDLLVSISEHVPLDREPDVDRFLRKVGDSQGSYSAYHHPCDGQPHLVSSGARSSLPSQDGAQACKEYAFVGLDASGSELRDTLGDSRSPRPSNLGCALLGIPSVLTRSYQTESGMLERGACAFQPLAQLPIGMRPQSTSDRSYRDEQSRRLFCDSYARLRLDQSFGTKVAESVVVSITGTEKELFYDLTVPFAQHYFAEGAIHHNSAKSCDAAVFGLEFWLQAPDRTAVVVCSTTMKMLRRRIWNYFAQYHSRLPRDLGNVGELLDSDTMIRWTKGDSVAGIFGMAVEEGPVDEVINNLIGLHPQRYLLILDEAQGVREAIMSATTNMAKNPWFGGWLFGNPDDMQNPLLRESEPIDGWGTTLDRAHSGEIEEWETIGGPTKGRGLCQFFDGRKSPADDSPEELKRLPFLINREWREAHLKGVRGNENDPSYWAQAIGLPPPMGITSTVLDASIVQKFNCRGRAVWTQGKTGWASLDPAFEGGDKCVLTIGDCGETEHNGPLRWQIAITEQVEVPIDAKSDEPVDYQIVRWVKEYLTSKGISAGRLAIDSSGRGRSLLSIFRTEFGPVMGVEFGGAPSESNVAGKDKTAKEEYDRRSSELNFNVREFALSDGLRGLTETAEKQFCGRRTYYKNKKYCVEPKTVRPGTGEKGYKQRMGHSPDHADSVAIGVALCKEVFGAQPVMDDQIREATVDADVWFEQSKKHADEYSSDNYLHADEPTIC